MSRIKNLLQSYSQYIAIPWRVDAAAMQRVMFCVYPETEEIRLRHKIEEFELASRQHGHDWFLFDLTDTFPVWLAKQRYVNRYFERPQLLSILLPDYTAFLATQFHDFIISSGAGSKSVIALHGVGSVFGFLKVKDLVDKLAPMVQGRLLVFFPGSFENNNYRLLDGYDGWNYLAVPITPDMSF